MTTTLSKRVRVIGCLLRRGALAVIMLMARDDAGTLRGGLHDAIRDGKGAISLRWDSNGSAHGHVSHAQVVNKRVKAYSFPMAISYPVMDVGEDFIKFIRRQCANSGSRFQPFIQRAARVLF